MSIATQEDLENNGSKRASLEGPTPTPIPTTTRAKSKSKAKAKAKGSNLSKSEYESIVRNLNRKLSQLRSIVQPLDKANVQLYEQMMDTHEERIQMELILKQRHQKVQQQFQSHCDTIERLKKQLIDEENEAAKKCKKMQQQYKAEESELVKQRDLVAVKYSSLTDCGKERARLLHDLHESHIGNVDDQERKHLEYLNNIVQHGAIKRSELSHEMQERWSMFQNDILAYSAEIKRNFVELMWRKNYDQSALYGRLSKEYLRRKERSERIRNLARIRSMDMEIMQDSLSYIERFSQQRDNIIARLEAKRKFLATAAWESSKYARYCEWLRQQQKKKQQQYDGIEFCEMEKEYAKQENAGAFEALERAESHLIEVNMELKSILKVVHLGVQALLEEEIQEMEIDVKDKRSLLDYRAQRQRIANRLAVFMNDDCQRSTEIDIYTMLPTGVYRIGSLGFMLPKLTESREAVVKKTNEEEAQCLCENAVIKKAGKEDSFSSLAFPSVSSHLFHEDLRSGSTSSTDSMLILHD